MADEQSHSFKEISDYVVQQALNKKFQGDFYPGKIWMAITQLTKKTDSEYARIRYGVYQKGGQRMSNQEYQEPNWEFLLDKSVELQNLFHASFSQEAPMPDMTPEEAHNYKTISESTAAGIDEVINGIAAWLAQMEDHELAFSGEHDQGMSMKM